MKTTLFILVVMGVGFLLTMFMDQRRRNFDRENPGRENPIQEWLTGEEDKEPGTRDGEEDEEDGNNGQNGADPGRKRDGRA